MRIVDDGFVELADVTADVTAGDGHGPNGDQEKIAGTAGDGDRNDPAAARLSGAGNVQRFGNEYAEPFAGIVSQSAAFETVLQAEVETIPGSANRRCGVLRMDLSALAT